MNEKDKKRLRKQMEVALKALNDFEEAFDDDYNLEPEKKTPYGRIFSIQMCLSAREKSEFEEAASEYMENATYHIPSKSALLRYLWRYFLKNRDDIDLSEYVD